MDWGGMHGDQFYFTHQWTGLFFLFPLSRDGGAYYYKDGEKVMYS